MKVRENIPLLVILLLAVLIKLGYLFFAFPDPSSVARLSIDELYHYKWAALIATGDIFANAPYFRAPFYPFLLAFLLKISAGSLVFVRLVQLLAGCVSILLVYRLAERMAGRTAATWAAALYLLYPMTTYFEGELLLDSLFVLFLLACLYFMLSPTEKRGRSLACGLFFALAAITRPTILVFAPLIAVYYLRHWGRKETRRESIRNVVTCAAISALVMAPITIINFAASKQFILVSYQGGINFYIGNNADADGISSNLPPYGNDWTLDDASYLAFQESGRQLLYGSQSSFWYRQGLRYIIDHPGGFMKLTVRKLFFLFSGHEISNNRPLDEAVFGNALLSKLPIRFPMMAALGILPLFLLKRQRSSLYAFYGLIIVYAVTVSLYFVSSRFRLPLVPLIAILAGWGAILLWDTIRRRHIGYRLFFGVVAAGAVLLAGSLSPIKASFANPDQALFMRGNRALREADYRTAVARFESLSQRQPYYDHSFLNLGIAYLKLGDGERASQAFRDEISHNDRSAEAYNNIGVVFLLGQAEDSARYYCRRALEIKPYYTEAAVNYLRASRSVADSKAIDGIETLRRSIRSFNENRPAYLFEEALYFTARGRLDEAIDNHVRLINLLTEQPAAVSFEIAYSEPVAAAGNPKLTTMACYQLGYLYGLKGDFANSVEYSRRALAYDPDLKQAYINLISGLRSLGESAAADSVARIYISRWPAPTPRE